MIQCPCHRNDSAIADTAVCRLQSDNAAMRRGDPNGASRVRSERRDAKIRCNSGARTARGAAGMMIQGPRIMNGPEISHRRGSAKCELMKVELAEENGARLLETSCHFRVFHGYAILEHATGGGRPNAGRIYVVLQCDWNAM